MGEIACSETSTRNTTVRCIISKKAQISSNSRRMLQISLISPVTSVRPSVLPSVPPSFCLNVSALLSPEAFPWNFTLETFMKICPEISFFLKQEKKLRNFTWRRFIFACEIKSPQKLSLGVKIFQTVIIDEDVQTLCKRATILYFVYVDSRVIKLFPTILSIGAW